MDKIINILVSFGWITKKKALKESIKRWEYMVKVPMQKSDSRDCALCRKYIGNNCMGCPVSENTGRILCNGTPYYKHKYAVKVDNFDKAKKEAENMLQFLKDLQ